MSLINRTLQNCYLENSKTENFFLNLINYNEDRHSRYLFFYANYLIKKNFKSKKYF